MLFTKNISINIYLEINPIVSLNMSTNKGFLVFIDSINSLSSPNFFKKFNKKTLKRLSYSLDQIIGEIYFKKAKITAKTS